MAPALVALAIGAGIALVLIGTGVLLAVDNSRAGVRQTLVNFAGFALIGTGFGLVSLVLRALT